MSNNCYILSYLKRRMENITFIMEAYAVIVAGPFFDEPTRALKALVLNVERNEVVAIQQEAHLSTKISTVLSMEVLGVNVSSADTSVALK